MPLNTNNSNKTHKLSFGENLKELRINAKLTQNDVADMLKISRQSISKWEHDIALPLITYIIPLTKILNCSIYDLFKVFY